MRAYLAALLLPLLLPAPAQAECGLADLGSATVAAVRADATLVLADGRTLRLAGIEPGPGAQAALARAVAKSVTLRTAEAPPTDRYGRLSAFAALDGAGLAEMLLTAGAARVAARAGGPACAGPLLEAEARARAAGRGLWSDPNFAPLPGEPGTRAEAELGRFVLVEGRVLSVRRSGATIYVNFGRRWTRDVTAVIPGRLAARFRAAGRDPPALSGRRIRVRGWLERRTGPTVELLAPEQIELLE
jgi:endonuclease YncB( thermonuclease family)